MELNQAKEIVANMATREPAVYTKREQTSSWNRVYELAGETNYTRNGIIISNTESVKLEYLDGESIDLRGLVVKYTGDNTYTEAVEKAELDDVCENWSSETSTARIESDDTVVDHKVTKKITISARENPNWTAEVEITVKENIPDHFTYNYPMTAKVYDDNVVVLLINGSSYPYNSQGQSVYSNDYNMIGVEYTNGEYKGIKPQDITVSIDDSHNVTITYSDENNAISDNIDSTYVGTPLGSLGRINPSQVVFPMGTKFTKASNFHIGAYYDYDYPKELRVNDTFGYHLLSDDECTILSPDTNTTGMKFVTIKCNANDQEISIPVLITGGDIPVTITSSGTTISYTIDANDLPTGYELNGTDVTLNDGTPLVDDGSSPIRLTGFFGNPGDDEREIYVNENSSIVSDLVSAYGWYSQPIAKLVLAD